MPSALFGETTCSATTADHRCLRNLVSKFLECIIPTNENHSSWIAPIFASSSGHSCHTAACSARVQLEPLDIQTARLRPRCCSERQSRATQSPAGCGNMRERVGYWLAV